MSPKGAKVGIGFRRELAAALFAEPSVVDFVEVVSESCREGAMRREAKALAEIWPVVPHGVKLSLGSAEGIDDARAKDLAKLARELRSPVVSEHVSFVRAGGREIGHLTELPMTRDAVAVVAKNVGRLRRFLPDVPLLLENVARAFVWKDADNEMTEGDFYQEIVRATGCDLLLDLGNLYANAKNANTDPVQLLESYPLDRVAMVHVAGGIEEHGFYFDTHADPVPDAVYDLVARAGCDTVMLERDAAFDAPYAVLAEVGRLREVGPRSDAHVRNMFAARRTEHVRTEHVQNMFALGEAQTRLAEALTSSTPTEDRALARARGVLMRKREEDAQRKAEIAARAAEAARRRPRFSNWWRVFG